MENLRVVRSGVYNSSIAEGPVSPHLQHMPLPQARKNRLPAANSTLESPQPLSPEYRGEGSRFHSPSIFSPNCQKMKLHVSVSSSMIFPRGLPAPCPALVSRRNRIGWLERVAAWRRAAILRA